MFSSNTSSAAGGYQISRSLRFNSADSAYLNRTPASAGNRRTWTWSSWIKLNKSGFQNMFTANIFSSGSDSLSLRFYLDTANFQLFNNGSGTSSVSTTAVLRDYSAWYHVVFAVDTTQATASDRVKIYINGVQQATTGTITLNYDTPVNSTSWASGIGAWNDGSFGMDAYMTEINFIDGQQLTPSSFGETNAQTGVWQPKAYSGSYGTNGFYLNFSDNSNTTAATLGKDYSGNGNNWTPNNFSVSAGAGNDSLVDTPTPYGTDTGAGGTVRGNYCTWNPLAADSSATITNGNLDVATAAAGVGQGRGTIGVSSGKWYWEVTRTTSGANLIAGIVDSATGADKFPGQTSGSYGYYGLDGTKINNGSFSAYGASFGIGDVIGVALDLDAGTLVFYKNGTSQGTAFTGLSGTFFPAASDDTGGAGMNYVGNFGQRPFAYTAPSGFKALCTQNLPTPAIGATSTTQAGRYFNAITWTGNGTNPRSITGVGFQPDFVWVQRRDVGYGSWIYDVLRGAANALKSESTAVPYTYQQVNSFDADGFTQAGTVDQGNNISGGQYVAWNWKANGAGVTNTAGSITSTVSANTTSGFSVVTWTGTGIPVSIGHGLGAAPKMVITKNRDNTCNWFTYHEGAGASYYLELNTTVARNLDTSVWQNTAPTSSVFTIGAGINANGAKFVAYCFAAVPGYSAFGSYTGNGSTDGPFVFTGFRPAFILLKSSSGSTTDWIILDNRRETSNVANDILRPNLSDAELVDVYSNTDFVSNGFKVRGQGTFGFNISGTTYIYAAFAESPFKYSLAR